MAGYLWGIALSMKYSKKSQQETKKALEKNWNFLEVFVDNVIDMHKDIYKYFEQKFTSKESKELIEEYKKKALDEVNAFKKEAVEKLEELRWKWVVKKTEIEKELKAIYEKRQEYFNIAKDAWEECMEEWIEMAKKYLQDWRKRLDKAFEDMKKKANSKKK